MLDQILQSQIDNDSLFHSYIIEGDKSATSDQVYEFAKIVFQGAGEVWNIIQKISPENNNISIDQIRKMTKAIYEKPVKYDYNIFMIEDAHFMRVEAQNALLKTLEELPSYSIVFMTSNNRFKLLDTIISRSQMISLSQTGELDFDEETTKNVMTLVDKALDGNYYIINKEKNLIKELSEYKHESLFIFTKIFTDLAFMRGTENQKYRKLLDRMSDIPTSAIENILLKIEDMKSLIKVNFNFQLAVEDLVFTIIKEVKKIEEKNRLK